ncbi:MAG: aminoglycoside phosphotransferase family protein [Phycisphaeraceae bacterium]
MSADPTLDGTVAGRAGPMDALGELAGPGQTANGQRHDTSTGPSTHGHHAVAPLPTTDRLAHQPAELPCSTSPGLFGTSLEPVLRHACQGKLSQVTWFRTDWQRGGAVTGYATYTDDQQQAHDVVVKLPVPPCERHWLTTLQPFGHVVPRVYAHGDVLGGYDLAWVVMERLPHGPLGPQWAGREFDLLAEAAGRFYAAARSIPPTGQPLARDWIHLCHRARETARDHRLPDAPRWRTALKKSQRKLKTWLEHWDNRPIDDWCHGDLHPGNAMVREPDGPALLFDFAHTRVGHWVEDAVYFEHLFWARRDRLAGRKLCKQIAQERKRHHLPVDSNWPELAQTKRALLAMSAPAQLHQEGDPHHLQAALGILEAAVR